MSFKDEEKGQWHEYKNRPHGFPDSNLQSYHVAECIHCKNPFRISDGIITDEIALCDICNGN